ncbi:hypothetical protein N7517_000917 [Penicillium concentricum]|uniref:Uncharacterized protein n=1 Tax=Penicillium concentricum TaxID=293559 RepID=A0A9W9VKN6_9EURO|nr:uncharacterized protein N7517_000917 [Penicillium concentricum]KAJ5383006.1 hypothetical protein N7517_000917 [Penicillium concentricum]
MSIIGYSDVCLGTQVTFTTPSPQKWVLEEKLSKDLQKMTSRQLELGSGPSFAVSKYLCYSATDSNKKAFMRIYLEIPNPGTESQLPRLRQQQAAPPPLLAYKEGKQGNNGVIPGGYITHIVWEMVRGKPLDTDQFWRPESARLREVVCTKFRLIWEELKCHGWHPGLPLLQNIIYDESSGDMHIAGFRDPDPFDASEKFSDMTFVLWRLTRPPRESGWENDPTKWAW